MSVRHRVNAHRQRMRERGYRSVQIWVPDVRSEAFAKEARRQAEALAEADIDGDDQDFVEAIPSGWDDKA